jgi:hypothetical protein
MMDAEKNAVAALINATAQLPINSNSPQVLLQTGMQLLDLNN